MHGSVEEECNAACRKQHKGFEKLLSLGGLWEIVKGKGKAITPAPFWVWEGLATHTPAAAELAAQAADVASAAKYFEVRTVHASGNFVTLHACLTLCMFPRNASLYSYTSGFMTPVTEVS